VAHVKAFEYMLEHDQSLSVNLGSETGVTVLEMVERVRALTGKPVPAVVTGRRAGDPAELVATSAHARELLGWEPSFSDLDTLISSTWKMYQRQ